MTLLSFVVQVYAESAWFSHWFAVNVAVLGQVSLEMSLVFEFFMTISLDEKVVFQGLHGAGTL